MTRPEAEPDSAELLTPGPTPEPVSDGTLHIDCDDCAVRGHGCQDCVVSVLLGVPETLLADERQALEVLADAGLAPRLRLVPIHRRPADGVA
ncbi:hypothetical protein [Mycolicibacterium sp. 050158]|jgi:hypothetical protein|uniref:hypothetical protein n=1 Tax=Mycolicibacterium sp. 050158 TaxID=3090602 RepID=UPI00299D376B|nr:hypothetical protein [Mycolicibacterium sp. 050158]MDX1893272.1 hypothetical protein [Mycolicibacterium sp. 050158]